MKKVYEKPRIIFESFNLNNSIAGDCEGIVGNPSKGSCGIIGSSPDEILFSSGVKGTNGCNTYWDEIEGDKYDGFCYHVPTEKFTLFNS